LDPYKQLIRDLLQQDDYRATWILDRIRADGYSGSYDTLKIYVRKIKQRLTRLAYIRFETSPGLQGQVDWADFQINEPSGATSTVYAFVMVLGFSPGPCTKSLSTVAPYRLRKHVLGKNGLPKTTG
jgi:transposase